MTWSIIRPMVLVPSKPSQWLNSAQVNDLLWPNFRRSMTQCCPAPSPTSSMAIITDISPSSFSYHHRHLLVTLTSVQTPSFASCSPPSSRRCLATVFRPIWLPFASPSQHHQLFFDRFHDQIFLHVALDYTILAIWVHINLLDLTAKDPHLLHQRFWKLSSCSNIDAFCARFSLVEKKKKKPIDFLSKLNLFYFHLKFEWDIIIFFMLSLDLIVFYNLIQ